MSPTSGYGSLWDDDVKGHTQGRGHSFLLGIGLWWDASGKMPSNRMVERLQGRSGVQEAVGSDPAAFAIEHKSRVKQFWDSADNTKSGLMENDVCDRPDLGRASPLSLKKEGKPVNYTAPKEGAIVWVDGLSLMKAAKNRLEQAYELINYLMTPEVSAQLSKARATTRSSPVPTALTSDIYKKNFQEASRAMP